MKEPPEYGKKRLYEVHYKSMLVQYHPWGEKIVSEQPLNLPILRLCHVTHNEQAEEIRNTKSGYFCFKSHQKPGKSYYYKKGCSLGESYVCSKSQVSVPPQPDEKCYKMISNAELVFPGYYSWWGLFNDAKQDIPNPPGYLKQPPDFIYGKNAFTSQLFDLLGSYASARHCLKTEICLKIGGTLRYKREIGYVVIVCTTNDTVLGDYAPITSVPDIIQLNGMVDDGGKVVDMSKVPTFITRHINAATSYEILNFAFYFSEQGSLECTKGTIRQDKIEHSFCTRSEPRGTGSERKWTCPDKE